MNTNATIVMLTELEKDFLQAGFSGQGMTGEFAFSQWLCMIKVNLIITQDNEVIDIIFNLTEKGVITMTKKVGELLKITTTEKGVEVLKHYEIGRCIYTKQAKEKAGRASLPHLGDIQVRNDIRTLAKIYMEAIPNSRKWGDAKWDYEHGEAVALYTHKLTSGL